MAEQYFRVIQTINTEAIEARGFHEQKLNNYLKYGEAYTNKELPKDITPTAYKKEVKHESTSTAMKDHTFIITTALCCEDESKEEGSEV